MFAKTLEAVFVQLLAGSDFAPVDPKDMARRFETLRSYGRLPMGRVNRSRRLSPREIAEAVLGLVPFAPGWAGHAATVLRHLRPVGGPVDAALDAATLAQAIERILTDAGDRASLHYLSISMSGRPGNVGGEAVLVRTIDGQRVSQGYVHPTSVSLLRPGGRDHFDPDALISPVRRDFRLGRKFFDKLAQQMKAALSIPEPPGDGSEYDEDDARKARLAALEVKPNASYLNVGIETQAAWPQTERVISFEGHRFVVMPATRETSASIHIDLHNEQIDDATAYTLINRLLSLMTWKDDAAAVCRDGWSGNPQPVAVPRRNLANAVTLWWLRPESAPTSGKARRALGYYREGRNAEDAELTSFAVLSYLKTIEVKFAEDVPGLKRWMSDNLETAVGRQADDPRLQRFDAARDVDPAEVYLWKACRVAVAHASENYPSDPDDLTELHRLSTAAWVLRLLARHALKDIMAEGSD